MPSSARRGTSIRAGPWCAPNAALVTSARQRPRLPVWLSPLLVCCSLVPGLVLVLLMLLVVIAFINSLLTNQQIQLQLLVLILIVSILWFAYIHLPHFIRDLFRSLWRRKRKTAVLTDTRPQRGVPKKPRITAISGPQARATPRAVCPRGCPPGCPTGCPSLRRSREWQRKPARRNRARPFARPYARGGWTGATWGIVARTGANPVRALAPTLARHGLGAHSISAEVARLIGCSPWTVRQTLIPRGLPHFRFKASGRLIFYRDQVIRWIENQQQGGQTTK